MESRFFKKTFSSVVSKIKDLAEKSRTDGEPKPIDSVKEENDRISIRDSEPIPKAGEQLSMDLSKPVPRPIASDEEEREDAPAEDGKEEVAEGCEKIIGFNEETGNYLVVHYRKGFEARLIQANPEIKEYYSVLKNELLSYWGNKSRISWTSDNFHNGRRQVAKINVKTGLLTLYLALDPASLEGGVYRGKDVSGKKKYEETPFEYKIRTPRKLKWALELIQQTCKEQGYTRMDPTASVDYVKQYVFESTEELVDRGLIKESITEESRSEISPELLKRSEGTSEEKMVLPKSEKSRDSVREKIFASVKISEIQDRFPENGTVNLLSLRERELVSPEATALRILLGDGEVNIPLKVEAEQFSPAAAYAVLSAGGEATLLIWKK